MSHWNKICGKGVAYYCYYGLLSESSDFPESARSMLVT